MNTETTTTDVVVDNAPTGDEDVGSSLRLRNFKNLSKSIRKVLEVIDSDGDGKLTNAELLTAAVLFKGIKEQNRRLVVLLLIILGIFAIMLAAIGGVVYYVIIKTKDTQVVSGALQDITGTTLRTAGFKTDLTAHGFNIYTPSYNKSGGSGRALSAQHGALFAALGMDEHGRHPEYIASNERSQGRRLQDASSNGVSETTMQVRATASASFADTM